MSCQLLIIKALVIVTAALGDGPDPKQVSAITRPSTVTDLPPYKFSAADEALLEEVQHAIFLYFWKEVGEPAGLVRDRKKAPVASSAAIGFQLSALPIGVEHGWITKEQGEQRATSILRSLVERDDNKKFGVYLHYPDLNTGGLSHEGFEILASTVDHALFLAGAITAGEYFGGDVAKLAKRAEAETNWRAFAVAPEGRLSMGWKPNNKTSVDGPGEFLKAHWHFASDEERITYFLAVAAPREDHAVPAKVYYGLTREIRRHQGMLPFVVSWSGTLFHYFFSHCWIQYAALGPDDPSRFGVNAPRVDWFENSRRAVLTHRQRCIEVADRFKTITADRWGLSACAARDGYAVPDVAPSIHGQDNWYEGTVAPYAAGSSIMFTPKESMAALRAFRELRDADGKLVVWQDPKKGGYGFADSFNLDQNFVSDDYVGIDQGPLLLAIENARSGLIWRLFMGSETAQRGLKRLGLKQVDASSD